MSRDPEITDLPVSYTIGYLESLMEHIQSIGVRGRMRGVEILLNILLDDLKEYEGLPKCAMCNNSVYGLEKCRYCGFPARELQIQPEGGER